MEVVLVRTDRRESNDDGTLLLRLYNCCRAIPALNKIGYLSYVYGYIYTLLQFHCICIVSQKNIHILI